MRGDTLRAPCLEIRADDPHGFINNPLPGTGGAFFVRVLAPDVKLNVPEIIRLPLDGWQGMLDDRRKGRWPKRWRRRL